jgi:hypothetical protein
MAGMTGSGLTFEPDMAKEMAELYGNEAPISAAVRDLAAE